MDFPMHRLNVRCCCEGEKILGTLDLAILQPVQRIYVLPVSEGWTPNDDPMGFVDIEVHTIQLKEISLPRGRTEIAVYSDDRPIEFWRRLSGFKEGNRVAAA
jgi:hypothetical protein